MDAIFIIIFIILLFGIVGMGLFYVFYNPGGSGGGDSGDEDVPADEDVAAGTINPPAAVNVTFT